MIDNMEEKLFEKTRRECSERFGIAEKEFIKINIEKKVTYKKGGSHHDWFDHLGDNKVQRNQKPSDRAWGMSSYDLPVVDGVYSLMFINHQETVWNTFGIQMYDKDDKWNYLDYVVKERTVVVH